MKMPKHSFRYLALFLAIYCNCNLLFSQSKTESYDLRIDPDNTISLTASTVFDEISYIPLETNKECVFGAISQLFVTDLYYVIQDKFTRSILIFKRDGKFHAKINRDIYSASLINVNQYKKEISFSQKRSTVFYDFNGKLVRTEIQNYFGNVYYLPDGLQVYYDYRVSKEHLKDTVSHEIFFARGKTKLKGFLPYNMQKSTLQSYDWISTQHDVFYESATGPEVLYTRPYDYNIYKIDDGKLNVMAGFLFPLQRSMPNKYLTDTIYAVDRVSYFKKFPDKIYSISFPYLFGNNLFFKLNSGRGFLDESFLYNLKNGALISIKKITPDQLSNHLPFTDFGVGDEFINKNFLTAHGGNIYTSMSSASMFKIISALKEDEKNIPTALQKYNKNVSRNDNPIIVQIKPKSGF